MLSEREMKSRISSADSFEVPVTNYHRDEILQEEDLPKA